MSVADGEVKALVAIKYGDWRKVTLPLPPRYNTWQLAVAQRFAWPSPLCTLFQFLPNGERLLLETDKDLIEVLDEATARNEVFRFGAEPSTPTIASHPVYDQQLQQPLHTMMSIPTSSSLPLPATPSHYGRPVMGVAVNGMPMMASPTYNHGHMPHMGMSTTGAMEHSSQPQPQPVMMHGHMMSAEHGSYMMVSDSGGMAPSYDHLTASPNAITHAAAAAAAAAKHIPSSTSVSAPPSTVGAGNTSNSNSLTNKSSITTSYNPAPMARPAECRYGEMCRTVGCKFYHSLRTGSTSASGPLITLNGARACQSWLASPGCRFGTKCHDAHELPPDWKCSNCTGHHRLLDCDLGYCVFARDRKCTWEQRFGVACPLPHPSTGHGAPPPLPVSSQAPQQPHQLAPSSVMTATAVNTARVVVASSWDPAMYLTPSNASATAAASTPLYTPSTSNNVTGVQYPQYNANAHQHQSYQYPQQPAMAYPQPQQAQQPQQYQPQVYQQSQSPSQLASPTTAQVQVTMATSRHCHNCHRTDHRFAECPHPCQFFLRTSCKHGDRCVLRHVSATPAATPPVTVPVPSTPAVVVNMRPSSVASPAPSPVAMTPTAQTSIQAPPQSYYAAHAAASGAAMNHYQNGSAAVVMVSTPSSLPPLPPSRQVTPRRPSTDFTPMVVLTATGDVDKQRSAAVHGPSPLVLFNRDGVTIDRQSPLVKSGELILLPNGRPAPHSTACQPPAASLPIALATPIGPPPIPPKPLAINQQPPVAAPVIPPKVASKDAGKGSPVGVVEGAPVSPSPPAKQSQSLRQKFVSFFKPNANEKKAAAVVALPTPVAAAAAATPSLPSSSPSLGANLSQEGQSNAGILGTPAAVAAAADGGQQRWAGGRDCRFYSFGAGHCQHGDRCHFRHINNNGIPPSNVTSLPEVMTPQQYAATPSSGGSGSLSAPGGASWRPISASGSSASLDSNNSNNGGDNLPYVCELCDRRFTSVKQLSQHEDGKSHRHRVAVRALFVRFNASWNGHGCTNCGDASHTFDRCTEFCRLWELQQCPRGAACPLPHLAL